MNATTVAFLIVKVLSILGFGFGSIWMASKGISGWGWFLAAAVVVSCITITFTPE